MGLSVGVTALGLSSDSQTGVGHHTIELLRHLPEEQSGTSYHYFGDLDPEQLPVSIDSHNHSAANIVARLYNDHYGIGANAEALNLDLLHAPKSSLPFGFSGRKSVTIHDLIFRTHPEYYSLRDRLYWRYVTGITVRLADGIVTVSKATSRKLRNNFNLEDKRIEVIPNGVDPARFTPSQTPSDPDRLEEYGITQPYYLYLGSDHPRKNLNTLLRAYARACDRWSRLPDLVLAGPIGRIQGKLLEQGPGSDIKKSINPVGYVAEDSLPALLRNAERLVYPSHAEGFGLPVLQSLCSGTPVACSDLPVLREVAGDNALYFDPGEIDSITTALDPSEGKPVSGTTRDRLVENYNWTTIADRYRKFFRELATS